MKLILSLIPKFQMSLKTYR